MVILYRRFGSTYRTLEDGTYTFPETSVKDYHSTLRNTVEEHSCHQPCGGSLKLLIILPSSLSLSRKAKTFLKNFIVRYFTLLSFPLRQHSSFRYLLSNLYSCLSFSDSVNNTDRQRRSSHGPIKGTAMAFSSSHVGKPLSVSS
jgi:hypothetical protein